MKQLVLQDDSSVLWWRSLLFYLSEAVKRDASLRRAWRSVSVEYSWISVMTCLVIGSNISNDSAGILWVLAYSCHGAIYPSWGFFSLYPSCVKMNSQAAGGLLCHNQLLNCASVEKNHCQSEGRWKVLPVSLINYPSASAKSF